MSDKLKAAEELAKAVRVYFEATQLNKSIFDRMGSKDRAIDALEAYEAAPAEACPYCVNGIVRSVGRDNDEIIEDCPRCSRPAESQAAGEELQRAKDSAHFIGWYSQGGRTPGPEYIWHAALAQGRIQSEAKLAEAQARIAMLETKYEKENASVKTLCLDWAEEDTGIKAVCAKFGIDTEGDSYGVPTMGECVIQLGEKAEAWQSRVAVLEKALEGVINAHDELQAVEDRCDCADDPAEEDKDACLDRVFLLADYKNHGRKLLAVQPSREKEGV